MAHAPARTAPLKSSFPTPRRRFTIKQGRGPEPQQPAPTPGRPMTRRTRRAILTLALLATLLAAVGGGLWWYTQTPDYQARQLLAELQDEPPGVVTRWMRKLGLIGPPTPREPHEIVEDFAALGTPAVPHLIQALRDADEEVRAVSVVALALIGPDAEPAIPDLIALWRRKRTAERWFESLDPEEWCEIPDGVILLVDEYVKTSWALSRIGSAAIPALERAFVDEDANVGEVAASTLRWIGPEGTSILLRALTDRDASLRARAVFGFRRNPLASRRVLAALFRTLGDPNEAVREATEDALERIRLTKQTLSLCLQALKDNDKRVRAQAGKLLEAANLTGEPRVEVFSPTAPGQLTLAEALPVLTRALEDEDYRVRLAVVDALREADVRAKGFMQRALEDKHMAVRVAAAAELVQIWDTQRYVAGFLADANAADADAILVNMDRPGTKFSFRTVEFRKALRHPDVVDSNGRRQAAKALKHLMPRMDATMEVLFLGLTDPNETTRERAGKALTEIRLDQHILRIYRRALNAKEEPVRLFVAERLGTFAAHINYPFASLFHYDPIPLFHQDERTSADALSALISVREDNSPRVRLVVIDALQEAGAAAKRARAALPGALEDEDSDVRLAAVDALRRAKSGAKESIAALKGVLRDKDLKVRAAAGLALAEIGDSDEAARAVAIDLADGEANVRQTAAKTLEKIGPPAGGVAAALLRAVCDPDPSVANSAQSALIAIGLTGQTLPAYLRTVTDGPPPARSFALWLLGEFRGLSLGRAAEQEKDEIWSRDELFEISPREAVRQKKVAGPTTRLTDPQAFRKAVPVLIKALGDEDPRVRRVAARMLGAGEAASRPAATALARLLDDKDAGVRLTAAVALGKVGRSGPAVKAILRDLKHDKPEVRRMAAAALGQLGPLAKAAAGDLVACLRDKDRKTQSAVATALPKVGTPPVGTTQDLLRALADTNPAVRAAGAWALGKIRPTDPAVLAAVLRTMEDNHPDVCIAAAVAAADLGQGDRAVAVLADLLEMDSPISVSAAAALARLGPAARPAIGALEKVLRTGDLPTRRAAANALRQIRSQPPTPRPAGKAKP